MTAIPTALHRPAADPFAGMDVEAARAFLRRLDPDAQRFTLQTFDDTDAERKSLAGVHHVQIDGPWPEVMRGFNVQRAGIFACVNETDGRGRKAHNIVRVRACFVDLDGSPLDPVLDAGLAPHIVVESSPGRWHAYWRVSDCPLDQFERVQKAIARRFNGDPNVNDLPRVMRLPGFLHMKTDKPFQTKMINGHDGEPYTLAEIVGTLGLSFDEPRVNGHTTTDDIIGEGSRNVRLFAFGRRLHAQGKSDAEIDAAMRRENAARCNPPLPEGELVGLIRNVQNAKDDPAWEPAHEGTPYAHTVHLLRGDSIALRPVAWLWRGYLARGKLHIVAGAPGTGKTTLAIALAATVTIAGRWPDGTRAEAGDVLIWSGEDAAGDTLMPRLLAAGADPSRVHFVGDVVQNGKPATFDPAAHFPALARAAAGISSLRLMIVDPIVSAVAGDSHHNAEVRRGLAPLVDFAEKAGCALVGISHFSKGTQGREPLERVAGSLGFGAVARIVFGTAKLREADGGGRALVRVKSNLGPDGGGFGYDIRAVELDGKHAGIETTRIEWREPIEGSAREILANAETVDAPESEASEDAASWLRELLTEAGGSMERRDVMEAARRARYPERTIYRSREKANVHGTSRGFGEHKRAVWVLAKEAAISATDSHSCHICPSPEEAAMAKMDGLARMEGAESEPVPTTATDDEDDL